MVLAAAGTVESLLMRGRGGAEAKTAFYALIQKLDAEFIAEFSTSQCVQLLADAGCEASSAPSARSVEYYIARPCAHCRRLNRRRGFRSGDRRKILD